VSEVNVFTAELGVDEGDPPPFDGVGYVRLGKLLGASKLGMTIYEIPPGKSNCPYHYEIGNEEWLLVLAGTLTLRTPDGETELGPWDTVCFRDGEEGAHRLTNRTSEPVRVAMLSTLVDPSACVYPDSGKVGIWPPGKLFRLADAVDYWEGEGES
jgi:uncharacterized cupin superfamily protein